VCESTVWKKATKNKGSLAGVPLPTKQKGGLLSNPKSKIRNISIYYSIIKIMKGKKLNELFDSRNTKEKETIMMNGVLCFHFRGSCNIYVCILITSYIIYRILPTMIWHPSQTKIA
jgi:hypothetical protein